MAVDAATTAGARLSPDESQQTFRVLLDALAHPGRTAHLPAALVGRAPMALVPLLAMADLETVVAVVPDRDGWGAALTIATGAPVGAPVDAEWVACLEAPGADLVARLDVGSAEVPERGTRLVVAVESLTEPSIDATSAAVLRLRGPGVAGATTLAVGGVDDEVFAALARANADFPAGIDTWLVTVDGTVAAIPRSTTLDVLDAREGAR